MATRPFFVYSLPPVGTVSRVWVLQCRVCNTHEYIGATPARAHHHAATHAKWWHRPPYTIPVHYVAGIA